MRRTWMATASAALLVGLVGCTQRAELAPRKEQGPQGPMVSGPVTLRYNLEQGPRAFEVRVKGESTGAYNQGESADKKTLNANFESRMRLKQERMGAADITERQPAAPEQPGMDQTQPNPADTPSESAGNVEVHQQVQTWEAQVQLPQRQGPNQFSAQYSDGKLNTQVQGLPINVPGRYREAIEQTLQHPVRATVTPKGEILSVQWPVMRQFPMQQDQTPMDSGREFYYVTSNSLGALNLWFGMIRLPDEQVQAGDTWSANERVPVKMGKSGDYHLQRDATYTLKGVRQQGSERVAEIGVTESLKLMRGAADSAASEPPLLLQTRTGTVHFNVDQGAIDRAEQSFNVGWEAIAPGQGQGGIRTDGHAEGTMNLQRVNGNTQGNA